MNLPLEPLMRICDFVAGNDDRRTLKRCVLVCSQLASYCNTYLFAKVNLMVNEHPGGHSVADQRRFQKLARIMEKNREIASCIKSLTVYFSSQYHQTSLPPFFAGCTNVTDLRLSVTEVWSEEKDERPTLLPDATDAVLDPILSSGNLKKLSIYGFQTPTPAFFARCNPSLSHLELSCMEENAELLPSEKGRPGPPIHLRHVEASPTTLSRFASAEREDGQAVFDFSQLQAVVTCFRGYKDCARHVNELLRHEVPLETLDVNLNLSRISTLESLFLHQAPLRCFSTLRHIKASMSEPLPPNVNQDSLPIRGLQVELGRFPAKNVLESVRIIITVVTNDRLGILKNDLHTLVEFFAQGRFPALQEVKLEVIWQGSPFHIYSLPSAVDSNAESSNTFNPGYLTNPTTWDFNRPNLDFRLSYYFAY